MATDYLCRHVFLKRVPDADQTTVEVSSATVATGATCTVTVTVWDAIGRLVAGRDVTITVSGTGNTITQPVGRTNSSGVAVGSFVSSVAEAKSVGASVNGVTVTATEAVTVQATGATWRANEPVGLTEFASTDFTNASDWNFFAGSTGTASGFDASAVSPPRSSPHTARFVVPTGSQPGRFIGNADPGNFASPAQRVYTCAWIRYSALATMHPAVWKLWYFYHNTSQSAGGAVVGMRPDGDVASGGILLTMESQGGSGTTLWLSAASVITRGQWHLLETDMQYATDGTGTFRAWVDGVLVLDVSDISYNPTNGGWADLHLDPYYGGESPSHEVDTETYLDMDAAYISWSGV